MSVPADTWFWWWGRGVRDAEAGRPSLARSTRNRGAYFDTDEPLPFDSPEHARVAVEGYLAGYEDGAPVG